jgi:hypothetical protein
MAIISKHMQVPLMYWRVALPNGKLLRDIGTPTVMCLDVCRLTRRSVSPSYSPGMRFKTLSFFSPVSGGPPERPVVLTCVAQTGVMSPGGDEQATRYYPPSLIRALG